MTEPCAWALLDPLVHQVSLCALAFVVTLIVPNFLDTGRLRGSTLDVKVF